MWLSFHSNSVSFHSIGCGIRGCPVAFSMWMLMPSGHSSQQTPTDPAQSLTWQPASHKQCCG